MRHPGDPNRYLMGRSLAPALVTADDILAIGSDLLAEQRAARQAAAPDAVNTPCDSTWARWAKRKALRTFCSTNKMPRPLSRRSAKI